MSRAPEYVPLRELIQVELAGLGRDVAALSALTDAKFVTFRTLVDAQASQVALALAAADKAVTKAELATEKRFDSVNEFRAALAELSALMATRRELESAVAAVALRVDGVAALVTALTTRIDTSEGKSKGIGASFGAIIGAIGAIVAVATLVLVLTRPGG